jgi:hypothetical protein
MGTLDPKVGKALRRSEMLFSLFFPVGSMGEIRRNCRKNKPLDTIEARSLQLQTPDEIGINVSE